MVFWVFGYGSLVWNPGFQYEEKVIGFIKDYRRVFDLGKFHIAIHSDIIQDVFIEPVYAMILLYNRYSSPYFPSQLASITEVHQNIPQELARWSTKKERFA